MDIPTLKAENRKSVGSRAVARLRRAGKLPAVVYGHKEDPQPVTVDQHEAVQQLEHGTHLINLDIAGTVQPCLIKDTQYDHLDLKLLHMDLSRVNLTERVTVSVSIEFRGTPKGAADGGQLFHELNDVEVECLVTDIPENIRVDVSDLGINEKLRVKDIPWPEKLKVLSDEEAVIAAVREPTVKAEGEETTEGEGEGTEPEVIAKGKEEEDKEKSGD